SCTEMSMDESRGSTPSVDVSDSPSPAPSSSQTPTHPGYANGYHNGSTDFCGLGSPGPQNNLSTHMQAHPLQSRSPAGMHVASLLDDHQFIKRPLNAYMIWTVQERKKILAKDPKMKMNDVSRLMGEKWKTLSDKEKRPFFEMSKQSKLEHKKALKDNPNLIYHPQRKKPLKGLLKGGDASPSMDIASGTSLSSAIAQPPTLQSATRPRPNGYSSSPYQQTGSQSQVLAATPGTVLVAQALGVRTPLHVQSTTQQGTPISFTFHTPQTQSTMQQRSAHTSAQYSTNATQHNGVIQQGAPASMHQMLDLYYTSLCQPAFPEPGETNTMAPPQYYLDQYQQLHYQAVANQHYGHQTVTAGHASYQAI
uniref:Sex-determining region Y protein n=1 Tax=Parascaris univalens TaxID=6257 RepID=A0A914ZNM9_PARUN